jgi:very-short-patch-repair endonuclease
MEEVNRMGSQLPDRALARLAAEQEATISTAQMRELGLSHREIHVRGRRGTLHRVHRGVYVVGVPKLTPRGRLWAAVLACGGPEAAAISHATAAVIWRVGGRWPRKVDIATFGTSRSTEAIRVHHTLTVDDLTRHHGLPITTPWRTLTDIAPGSTPHMLERAVHEAAFHGLLDHVDLDTLIETGPRKLRPILTRLRTAGPQRTKSELEDQLLALVDRHSLPRPLVNVPLHGYTVDFLWPTQRLVVETDGRNHLRPHVYEADRLRDADLQGHGYRIYRVTARELDEHPQRVARRLSRWLA